MSERIERLPGATREQLLIIAALAVAPLALLDREALEPAEEAGLIEISARTASFSHPLFSAAVYGSATAVRRQELHRRLAGLVSDPEERARHLALGASEPSEEIALELERGAERAVSRGAPDAAADLLELAADLTAPDDRDRLSAREAAAAECHFHAGNPRPRPFAGRASARSRPRWRGPRQRLRLLGELRYIDGSFSEAISLFEEALEQGAQGSPRPRLSSTSPSRTASWATTRRQPITHARRSRPPTAPATARSRRPRLPCRSPGTSGWVTPSIAPGSSARWRSRTPTAGCSCRCVPPAWPGSPSTTATTSRRAASLYAELRQRAIDRGEDGQLPIVDADLSMVERSRGNLARALEVANEGCEVAQMLGSDTARADMLCERSFVRAALGDEPEAREDAEHALACNTDDGYVASWLGGARAFLELSLGNAQAANDALAPFRVAVEQAGSCNQFTAVIMPDQIEALVALGDLERADAFTGMLEQHASTSDRSSALASAARCRGLLAAARGGLDAAAHELQLALDELGRIEMPLELGRTLLASGQVARRAKQKRAAREAFTSALQTFEAIGAGLWAARARSELERTGLRHSAGDELTPTESRVADLAAQGLTNRRIAETLFLSAKTVEANIARVYLKLGIRSRAELGAAMAQRTRARSGSA